jgi:arylsulfatase A-like enzyme
MVRVLRQLDLWKGPFVTVTSDHGEGLFDHENFFGHVENLYEETINVPLLISSPRTGPALQPPSDRGTWNLETIDLTATLLEYGGAPPEELPGNSLYGVSDSGPKPHPYTAAFAEKGFVDRIEEAAVIRGTDKLIYDYRRGNGRLFSLETDSGLDEERKGSKDLKASLFEAIRKTLGETEQLNRKPAPPRKIPESEKKQLKGLGYLE